MQSHHDIPMKRPWFSTKKAISLAETKPDTWVHLKVTPSHHPAMNDDGMETMNETIQLLGIPVSGNLHPFIVFESYGKMDMNTS